MKNLMERISALPEGGVILCPETQERCYKSRGSSVTGCAHYNPNTQECVHVEQAQAQVRAAAALEQLAAQFAARCRDSQISIAAYAQDMRTMVEDTDDATTT